MNNCSEVRRLVAAIVPELLVKRMSFYQYATGGYGGIPSHRWLLCARFDTEDQDDLTLLQDRFPGIYVDSFGGVCFHQSEQAKDTVRDALGYLRRIYTKSLRTYMSS